MCFVVSVLVSSAALASDSGTAFGSAAKNGSVDTLTIGAPVAGTTSREILVPVTLNVHGREPSVITFQMTYDTSVLAFKAVTGGPAAQAAQKDAVANETKPGEILVIVWGFNTTEIDTGVILTATFELASANAELGEIFITGVNSAMADPGGDRVAVRMIYFAPATVTVSPQSDGVVVQWSEVLGAAEYRVFRSETEDPEAADSISGWLPSTELLYLDDSVTVDPEDPDYCQNLFYWVVAANADDEEGTPSEPAGWNPGAPAAPETVAVTSISWEGVLVEWSAVDNAGSYQVYRGTSDDPNEAEAISEWLPASTVSHLDSEVIRGSCTLGCADTCQTYYYWVRSESESGCEGTFSSVAVGEGLSLVSSKMTPVSASVVPGAGLGREAFGDILLLGLAAGGLLAGRRLVSSRRDV
jgi:hypothetical protein